jgi:hypothetical protein
MNAKSEIMRQSAEEATSRFSNLEAQMLKAMTHSSNALDSVSKLNEKVDRLTDMMEQVTSFLGAIQTQQPSFESQHQLPTSDQDENSTTTNGSEASHMKSPAKKKTKSTTTAPSGDQYKDPSSEAGGEKC